MSASDDFRDRMRSAGASLSVGTGSVADVQARAGRLQRRRTAARGSLAACALAAVVAVGVLSLRGPQQDTLMGTVATEALSSSATSPVEESDLEESDGKLQAADADQAADEELKTAQSQDSGASGDSDDAAQDSSENSTVTVEGATGDDASDGSENRNDAPPESSESSTAAFAQTVSEVHLPFDAEGVEVRYSFSGSHAVVRAENSWYAYDGADWKSVGLPDDMEVVAVDLSAPGRIAVFGVVRPNECDRQQVVAVRADENWTFLRVDDDTPPMVGWELLDARVRVTDTGIELERVERLWLDEQCGEATDPATLSEAAAALVAQLQLAGEIRRDSWPHAVLQGGFASRWPHVAQRNAFAAAAFGGDVDWTPMSPSNYTTAAQESASSEQRNSSTEVALDQANVMDVETKVIVSDGMALLTHGDQTWEICPVGDDELEIVVGAIGLAGRHLAVVVGKPEPMLFVVERTD